MELNSHFTLRGLHALGGIFLDIFTCMRDSLRGFELEIGYINRFEKRLVTTFNYSAIADLRTLQITRAHRIVFSVCYSLH
jgi:hypothetical protein